MENTHEQNLELIAQMIRTAQRRFYDDSPYYILWGCAIFCASLLQFLLINSQVEDNGIGWIIFIPAGIVGQLILLARQKKNERVKTHVETVLVYMWIAFGVSLFIVLVFSFKLGLNTYPVILCLYALSTFISGGAFRIRAFLFGSVCCWILAVVAFFADFQTQLLLLAAGVLAAFIVPGIILRSSEREHSAR